MKILQLDVETAPNLATVWGIFKQNIGINQLLETSRVLCFVAKWYGEKEIIFSSEQQDSHYDMMQKLWQLMDDADAIVHYNGERFDVPVINREFLKYKLDPPAPYQQIDLLKTVKKRFRFVSNKLDHVSQELEIGKKIKHEGHELWLKCMDGCPKAWKRMERYNIQDVKLLEKLYVKLLPWIKNHPNHGLFMESDKPVCTNCGSTKLHKKGCAYTNVGIYQRYKCTRCGTPLRGRTQVGDKAQRTNVLSQDKR